MIKNYSRAAHRPDSLYGIVAAFEGIRDAYTMLNCPIGCKIPLGYTSSLHSPHFAPVQSIFSKGFYFGQSRLPCTYTDEQDFVYGTEEKIKRAIQLLDQKGYGMLGVVNHSGTALIGDDLCRIIQSSGAKTPSVVVDASGFTGTYAEGFKTGAVKILESLAKTPKDIVSFSVNIIGPTVFHYNWKNDVIELKQMLRATGVEVVSVICAGETVANLKRAGEAALNVVVYEEYGDSVAHFLEKEYGTPSIGLDTAAPIGLNASDAWFGSVADFFHLHRRPIELRSKSVRMKCYQALSRMSGINNTLRGAPFAVFGDSSQVTPLVEFFYEYLGMYPVLAGLKEVGSNNHNNLKKYVSAHSLRTCIKVNPDQYEIMEALAEFRPIVVLGSGIEKHISMLSEGTPEFIPLSFPYNEKVLLTKRPLIGFNGVLSLVEDAINASSNYYSTHRKIWPY